MKKLHVVCGVIVKDNLVFCCCRPKGKALAYFWEFPGGKVEDNETEQEALKREIKEELNTNVIVGEHIVTVDYTYDQSITPNPFSLTLSAYFCTIESGKLEILEHSDAKWVGRNQLDNLNFAPADRTIIDIIMNKN